jgi:8-oxo-dGTP pyrophosphatase MutT (NUDIX family)
MLVAKVYSAGGIVYRRDFKGIQIILCGRVKPGIWVLPKGTPILGESITTTAVREVVEETGLLVSIERKIGIINYQFQDQQEAILYDKKVHFFLMIAVGGSINDHDHEFDVVEWCNLSDALVKMTHANEVRIVGKAVSLFEG